MNKSQQRAVAEEIRQAALVGTSTAMMTVAPESELREFAETVTTQDKPHQSLRLLSAVVSLVPIILIIHGYFNGRVDLETALVLVGGIGVGGIALPIASKRKDKRVVRR